MEELASPHIEAIQLFYLMQAQSRLQIHEVGLAGGLHHVNMDAAFLALALPRVPLDAMKTQTLDARQEFILEEGDGAPFAGGHVLVRVEAVNAHHRTRIAPHFLALVGRPHSLRRVFNHPEAVFFGDGPNLLHGAGQAREVHGDDALGAGRDGRFELGRIHVERYRINIHEHRNAALQDDR